MTTIFKKCSIDGCERKHKAKTYCDLHYYRFRKNGCPHSIKLNHKPEKGSTGFKLLYSKYKRSAAKRGYDFSISKDYFKFLTKTNCFYCNSEPSQVIMSGNKTENSKYTYNGVDRIDNTMGYTEENCVSCCSKCNIAKNTQTFSEFVEWAKKVVNYYNYLTEEESGTL